jgi:hypothetical protein
VGVWLRFVKRSVGVSRGNRGFEIAERILGWVRGAFGGFVLRAAVARMAQASIIEDGRWSVEGGPVRLSHL